MSQQDVPPVSRRKLLVAAGAALPVTAAVAQTSQPTTKPSAPAVDDDLAAAVRLAGRNFSEIELQLIRQSMRRTQGLLARLRRRAVPPALDPAVTFDPWLDVDPPPAEGISAAVPEGEVAIDPNDDLALAFASVADLARLLRSGKVTSVRLTELALDRLERHGLDLHCVVTLTRDFAMQQARRADAELAAGQDRGPLHGIPYGAKDLLATKGIPTTYGVSPLENQVFDVDATVIRRLEDAGAVLCAKLSLGELAMGDIWFGGTTRNPWKPEQGSSGSSAGSSSAVAAGLLPFAIGSETLGSIVSPSVRCGVCGLRPTFGRVPRTGAMPLARTMDKLGPIARSTGDLALVLAAIAGTDGEDLTVRDATFIWPRPEGKPLVVGYDKSVFDAAARSDNAEVRAVYADALERCRTLFGDLVTIDLPDDTFAFPTAILTVEVESTESFMELMEAGQLGELVQQEADSWPNTFRRASLVPAIDYLRAQRVRREMMHRMAEAMGDVDVMVTIPLSGEALAITNLTGHPTCIARAGMAGGLPRQIEFIGRLYGEEAILAAASRFEAETPAATEWPREAWR